MNVSAGVVPHGLVKWDFSPVCRLTSIHPGSVSMSLVPRQPPGKGGRVINWCFWEQSCNEGTKNEPKAKRHGAFIYVYLCVCVFCQANLKQWLPSGLCRRKPTAVILGSSCLTVCLQIKFLSHLSPALGFTLPRHVVCLALTLKYVKKHSRS